MQKSPNLLKVLLALFLVALVLSSCGRERRGGFVLVSNCPAVGVIEHLNAITRFKGSGQTNQNVVFDAHISDLDVTCSEGGSVTTDISFSIRGKKGPAFEGQTPDIRYYVVIIRDNYLVTNKQVYTTRLNFRPGSDTASVRERLVQTFDNFEEPRRYDYEVLIGFEVSPEELAFNVVR